MVCGDITTIFVDGVQKEAAGTGVWNEQATLQIPASTRAIGIRCQNTGGPYGIMAQVADSEGKELHVSDNTWKCSNQNQDGWSKFGFIEDDSWNPAFYFTAWKGMSLDRDVIWTSTGDATVYCRNELLKTLGNYKNLLTIIVKQLVYRYAFIKLAVNTKPVFRLTGSLMAHIPG